MTDDDIWNLKVELVKLGNQGKFQEQIDFMLKNKNNLDYQFCSMFVMSFRIGSVDVPDELLKIIVPFIIKGGSVIEMFRISVIVGDRDIDNFIESEGEKNK